MKRFLPDACDTTGRLRGRPVASGLPATESASQPLRGQKRSFRSSRIPTPYRAPTLSLASLWSYVNDSEKSRKANRFASIRRVGRVRRLIQSRRTPSPVKLRKVLWTGRLRNAADILGLR